MKNKIKLLVFLSPFWTYGDSFAGEKEDFEKSASILTMRMLLDQKNDPHKLLCLHQDEIEAINKAFPYGGEAFRALGYGVTGSSARFVYALGAAKATIALNSQAPEGKMELCYAPKNVVSRRKKISEIKFVPTPRSNGGDYCQYKDIGPKVKAHCKDYKDGDLYNQLRKEISRPKPPEYKSKNKPFSQSECDKKAEKANKPLPLNVTPCIPGQ